MMNGVYNKNNGPVCGLLNNVLCSYCYPVVRVLPELPTCVEIAQVDFTFAMLSERCKFYEHISNK